MRSSSRMTMGLATALICLVVSGCDEGKSIYDEAVALEEGGKLAEAAEKYDAVCRRAPKSSMCMPSMGRAAAVRIKLAEQAIAAFEFSKVKGILEQVASEGDDASKERAKKTLTSRDMVEGLRWEKALANPDKTAAMFDMEAVAQSSSLAAGKAKKWLDKEQPSLLLAAATAACTPMVTGTCENVCSKLLRLYPNSPEAAKAKVMLEAAEEAKAAAKVEAEAREAERLYPLLVEAEKLLSQAKSIWRQQKAHHDCNLRNLAANPNNPLAAMVVCGDSDGVWRQEKKLKDAWEKLLVKIAHTATADTLKKRFEAALENGEYEKQTPKKPVPIPQPAKD